MATTGDARPARILVTVDPEAGFQLTFRPPRPIVDVLPGDEYMVECAPQWPIEVREVLVRDHVLVQITVGNRLAEVSTHIAAPLDGHHLYLLKTPLAAMEGERVVMRLRNATDAPQRPWSAVIVVPQATSTGRTATELPSDWLVNGVKIDGHVTKPDPRVQPGGVTLFETRAGSRPVSRPERIQIAPSTEPQRDWIVKDIQVGNRCGFCGKSFDIGTGHVCSEAAISPGGKTFLTTVPPPKPKPDPTVHHPRITRTLMEGPGNRTDIRGCACGAEVMSVEAYAAHVGWPVEAMRAVLDLYAIADDLIDYPGHPELRSDVVALRISRCLEVRRTSTPPTSEDPR